jgi:hypothetical protein
LRLFGTDVLHQWLKDRQIGATLRLDIPIYCKFKVEADISKLSPEEQEFLKAGYERGFIVVDSARGDGHIYTRGGTFSSKTHKKILEAFHTKGLVKTNDNNTICLRLTGKPYLKHLR